MKRGEKGPRALRGDRRKSCERVKRGEKGPRAFRGDRRKSCERGERKGLGNPGEIEGRAVRE